MMNGADRLANGATSDENNDLSGLSQARILVVDDDRDLTGLVRRELVGLGFTVDVVELAGDAMLAARNTAYALMIVDLGLPDRDGLELVRDMRARHIETPILVLTARNRVEDRVTGLSCGADDYLVKPFAVPEMRARVTALLRRPTRQRGQRNAIAKMVVDADAL
jgi:DNA-binding response OmpR family regulator